MRNEETKNPEAKTETQPQVQIVEVEITMTSLNQKLNQCLVMLSAICEKLEIK
jgi:hypothetical protein